MRACGRFPPLPFNRYSNNVFTVGLKNFARLKDVFSPWSISLYCLEFTKPRVHHFLEALHQIFFSLIVKLSGPISFIVFIITLPLYLISPFFSFFLMGYINKWGSVLNSRTALVKPTHVYPKT